MATTIRELLVKLGVDVNDAKMKKFDKGLERVKTGMGQALKFAAKLTGALGLLGGAFGARAILDTIVNYERLKEQLRTVLGDVDTAQSRFTELTDFAARTPFQLDGITEAFIRMQATGLKPTIEDMKNVGDFAAAFGKDITEFADAVIGATTGESERLKQFGIIARTQGEQVTFTFDGMTKVVKRDAKEIKKFLLDMAKTRFAGAMERQSKTLGGAISTLKDNISLLIFRLGEAGLRKSLTNLVVAMTGMTVSAEDAVDTLGTKLATAVDSLTEKLPLIRDKIVEISKAVKQMVVDVGGIEGVKKIAADFLKVFVAAKTLNFINQLGSLFQFLAAIVGGVGAAAFAEFILIAAGVIAQIILLTLVIDDLIVFFQGGDSALGRFIARFKETDTLFGRAIAVLSKLGEVIMAVADVALPIMGTAATTVFRIWSIQLRVIAAIFTFLFNEIILPAIDKFVELWSSALDRAKSEVGTFGDDVIAVFDAIFGAINAALDALEDFLGIAEPIDLGMRLATSTANGAAAPTAEAGAEVGRTQQMLASMSMGGDTNTISIDARGMNPDQLADTLEKRLDARDKQKRAQTRERFRGGDA